MTQFSPCASVDGTPACRSTLGTAFGYYTRDTGGFNHDVFLKNEELRSVGVVMLTSHHVVLYTKDHTVIVVPASDVAKLERHKPK